MSDTGWNQDDCIYAIGLVAKRLGWQALLVRDDANEVVGIVVGKEDYVSSLQEESEDVDVDVDDGS